MNRTIKIILLVCTDLVAFCFSALAAWYLTAVPVSVAEWPVVLILLLGMFVSFVLFGLYRAVLRYAGVGEMLRIFFAFLAWFFVGALTFIAYDMDARLFFTAWIFMLVATVITRFTYRLTFHVRRFFARQNSRGDKRVIIIGAGQAGRVIAQEMRTSLYLHYTPVCYVDDDKNKQGMLLDGTPVYGGVDKLQEAIAKYAPDELMIAIPSATPQELRRIIEICRTTNLRTRTLPGVYQLVNGEAHVGGMRDVEIGDLLGREQIRVNLDEIMGYIEHHVVLVTGGGGSIGSELCRQIARHAPKQLLILDIYENNLYDIEQELRRHHPDLPLLALVASVRDDGKMEDIFRTYRPDLVFHAAAHKHVPLMETSPNEAVKNNVFGTLHVARMADKYGARRFVQISTDKAVNPTNIMGATKRLCEMIIQMFSRHSKTEFVAVRFGNVLGSNGSVIPLFQKQIAEGGPLTVTHKDIIRYFMTIPEAVSLVLQAGAYAKGGEIFVLDMGEPVKIYDLAENLIRLSGLRPNIDIEIRCTGLRPGEKLFEERLMAEEGLRTTPNGMISIAKPLLFDEDAFMKSLDRLHTAAYAETDDMKTQVAALVPTYVPDRHQA